MALKMDPGGHGAGATPPEPKKYINPNSPFKTPTPEWTAWNAKYGTKTSSTSSTGGTGSTGGTKGAGGSNKSRFKNGSGSTNPNATPGSDNAAIKALQQQINALLNAQSGGGSGAASAAADLAERKREFDITRQRDIEKQNASEVSELQGRLAALSGPKDVYADYFFSHGLLPPRGYKPAPVPLTAAQTAAYKKQGVSQAQLQAMINGPNKPGAASGMLGSMAPSMATPPGLPQPIQQAPPTNTQTVQPPAAPPQATPPGGPVQQFGTAPSQQTRPPAGAAPGNGIFSQPRTAPVPSMASGGQVPGPPGTPSLAVVHGGEQVTPAPGGPPPGLDDGAAPQMPGQESSGQGMSDAPGLHPAIAALVDAVSGLLQNPDFAPFVQGALNSTEATPGGAPSMAMGGTVPTPPPPPSTTSTYKTSPLLSSGGVLGSANQSAANSTGPRGIPTTIDGRTSSIGVRDGANPGPPPLGTPATGSQGVTSNSGATMVDNPVMPIANMDPYTRALYDKNGRLHPYSAQQEAQMGTQGQAAVASYMGKVQGGDVGAYLDLVNRLKPQNGAPEAGAGSAGEGFTSA